MKLLCNECIIYLGTKLTPVKIPQNQNLTSKKKLAVFWTLVYWELETNLLKIQGWCNILILQEIFMKAALLDACCSSLSVVKLEYSGTMSSIWFQATCIIS